MSKITASIVTHRTDPAELRRVCGCLLRCPDLLSVDIIDNSPDDSLRDAVTGGRIFYTHVENRGFGAGHNIAIRKALEAGSDFHLVLNADTWWEGDVVSELAAYMEANREVGMMMPKVFYPDGDLQLTARRLPTPWDLFAKRFLPAGLTRSRMDRYLLARADHDRLFNATYLLGSFLFFRAEALREEGLFDERYFMYPEDIDITRRLHRNWKTLYYPEASIIHAHAAASRKSLKMLRIHISNMVRYFNKWGWLIDRERRQMNRRLEATLPLLPPDAPTPPQRG